MVVSDGVTNLTSATATLTVDPTLITPYTWDGSDNAEWFSSSGGHWSPTWVNDSSSAASVNLGYVYAQSPLTANSLTIGDGVGAAQSAVVKNSTDNAFLNISTITINADGILNSGGNTTCHLKGHINLNGGIIGGYYNGGSALTYGVFNFENTIHVTANSTIAVTGGGATLGQPGGTQFNVESGVTLSVPGNSHLQKHPERHGPDQSLRGDHDALRRQHLHRRDHGRRRQLGIE